MSRGVNVAQQVCCLTNRHRDWPTSWTLSIGFFHCAWNTHWECQQSSVRTGDVWLLDEIEPRCSQAVITLNWLKFISWKLSHGRIEGKSRTTGNYKENSRLTDWASKSHPLRFECDAFLINFANNQIQIVKMGCIQCQDGFVPPKHIGDTQSVWQECDVRQWVFAVYSLAFTRRQKRIYKCVAHLFTWWPYIQIKQTETFSFIRRHYDEKCHIA